MTGRAVRHSLARLAARCWADRKGATAIEYAMIAAGIGVTIASTVWGVGTALKTNWYDKMANMF